MRANHYVVTDYWLAFYANCHCTLCGNSGIVDTRGVKTAAKVETGRLNWCICPNGQALRQQSDSKLPSEKELDHFRS